MNNYGVKLLLNAGSQINTWLLLLSEYQLYTSYIISEARVIIIIIIIIIGIYIEQVRKSCAPTGAANGDVLCVY